MRRTPKTHKTEDMKALQKKVKDSLLSHGAPSPMRQVLLMATEDTTQ